MIHIFWICIWTLFLEALLCLLAVVGILARDRLTRTLILADEDVQRTTKIPQIPTLFLGTHS